MIILIDGYNVIKHVESESHTRQFNKNQFLELMSNYAKSKEHEIIIFFDGGSLNFPYEESYKYLTIINSGYKLSADDVIKKYLQDHKGLKLLLVTTDRELRRFAANLKLESVKAIDFYNLVRQKNEPTEYEKRLANAGKIDKSIYKTSKEQNESIDEIMRQAAGKVQIKKTDYDK